MNFKIWLENFSPSETFESEAQDMLRFALDMSSEFKGNINYALAALCLHMIEMEDPVHVGRILGIAFHYASHFKNQIAKIDRNETLKFLQVIGKDATEEVNQIKRAALFAYSTYEKENFTVDTIRNSIM